MSRRPLLDWQDLRAELRRDRDDDLTEAEAQEVYSLARDLGLADMADVGPSPVELLAGLL